MALSPPAHMARWVGAFSRFLGRPVALLRYFPAKFIARRKWLDGKSYAGLVRYAHFCQIQRAVRLASTSGWGRSSRLVSCAAGGVADRGCGDALADAVRHCQLLSIGAGWYLGAAFYDPVWARAIPSKIDFRLALATFRRLVYARLSPVSVVFLCAVAGQMLAI